ncbi:TrmH family RNA methyltransferase [Candidatus Saccharibacteria bacterium]|nr:TrmH family RNA methyltransferase [Candidatus Saccharibacteria bacterium]
MDLILVLDNIRSSYNVGAILRTAEGFGVRKAVFSGYTPRVHDGRVLPHLREKLDREIHKTALGAEEMVGTYASDDIILDLKKLKEQGYLILGLENNIEKPTFELGSEELRGRLTEKMVLILGEEVNGIDYSLHDMIDLFVEIPMRGKKESFNVSVAAGVAMYELTKRA